MPLNAFTDVATLSAALAALASFVATLLAYAQVNEQGKANLASVFLEFSGRYDDPNMTEAVRKLIHWRNQEGGEFANVWFRNFLADDARAHDLNFARRAVNRYFDDVVRARQAGLLSRKLARSVANHFGLLVYYDVVLPMNHAMFGPKYADLSAALRRIAPDYNGSTTLSAELTKQEMG